MSTRMLIDARHEEETRVTVVKGSRVEEFDYESASKRPLKGNIYLARVTRVEPSLQAAFVEYGGNRHGFLAFSEIHPDYYQIPVEDRQELIEAETKVALERSKEFEASLDSMPEEDLDKKDAEDASENDDTDAIADNDATLDVYDVDADINAESDGDEPIDADEKDSKESDEADRDAEIAEAAARRNAMRALKRKYNIQEVIKRRQVLLIQVVKEERGNKGAALTTYLSLAGRYCVLMPNSTHAGGISRKISNASDRRSLKKIISSLEVPDEMGLIVRTAGMERTKTEIKRDYDYLLRLWNGIRDLTLKSVAPALVYEEGNLIKRTIRDLYTRDIDEILVEGESGYKAAKELMKLLMPSHAKKVQHYKDPIPLFHRYQIENHLEAMFQPVVQLRSGGYIVINPTEALISIDVNSGRATKEHNIEETAHKTNLEAADEVARQLRLRDMAGLVVIDFIDMEERSHNRSVERRMKEVLKSDRARIQVGRISSFGLLEMSRQRLRSNLVEVSMETCPTCAGIGVVRSVESAALMALRQLEEEGIRSRSSVVRVSLCPEVAVYILNKKRKILSDLEIQYDFEIEVLAQPRMGPSDIEITREAGLEIKTPTAINATTVQTEAPVSAPVAPTAPEIKHAATDLDEDGKPKRKRRRRRRRRRGEEMPNHNETANNASDEAAPETDATPTEDTKPDDTANDGTTHEKPRRRRGSRGGRRRNNDRTSNPENGRNDETENVAATEATTDVPATSAQPANDAVPASDKDEKPRRRRRRVRKPSESDAAAAADKANETESSNEAAKPRRGRRTKADEPVVTNETATTEASSGEEKKAPRRRTEKAAATSQGATSEATTPVRKPRARRTKADTVKVAAETAGDATQVASNTDTTEKPKTRGRKKAEPKTPTSKPKAVTAKAVKTEVKADKADTTGAGTSPENDGQPKRKGWWNRTFG